MTDVQWLRSWHKWPVGVTCFTAYTYIQLILIMSSFAIFYRGIFHCIVSVTCYYYFFLDLPLFLMVQSRVQLKIIVRCMLELKFQHAREISGTSKLWLPAPSLTLIHTQKFQKSQLAQYAVVAIIGHMRLKNLSSSERLRTQYYDDH